MSAELSPLPGGDADEVVKRLVLGLMPALDGLAEDQARDVVMNMMARVLFVQAKAYGFSLADAKVMADAAAHDIHEALEANWARPS